MKTKKVLNVGGHDRKIALPPLFADYEQHMLDIDPASSPDVLMDARDMQENSDIAGAYDAVYLSHCLEHFYAHDVAKVLLGCRHALSANGFVLIFTPDILALMVAVVQNQWDLDQTLYQLKEGPISVMDTLYGWGKQIRESGEGYFAHKTGFSCRIMGESLKTASFQHVHVGSQNLEVMGVGFKGEFLPEVMQALASR